MLPNTLKVHLGYNHREGPMAEDNSQLTYSKTPVDKTTFVKLRQMDLDAGWLGNFFGGDRSAPANIAGLTVVLLTGCGIVHTFYRGLTE